MIILIIMKIIILMKIIMCINVCNNNVYVILILMCNIINEILM